MGLSWSKRQHHPQIHHQYQHPQPSYSTPPQAQAQAQAQAPAPPSYAFAANSPYLSLPPPPPQPYYQRPLLTYHPFFMPPPPPPPPHLYAPFPHPPPHLPPVPYVDHQTAKRIKNDTNVRKETIKILLDPSNPDCHLVSFTFDAMVDGSITIMNFGKEGANCTFTSVYPEMVPVKSPFQKGIGQKFCQPSLNGIDLGFFDVDDLSKPLQGDIFPLVILAESNAPSTSLGMQTDDQIINAPSHAQITLAVLEKNKESQFQVKVMKQILWVDGVRYELREIYGMSKSGEDSVTDQDTGKECVICMTDPKDTTVLPCRHMCLCSACAKELMLQSNKCPICRQPIQELLEIKIDEGIVTAFS